MCCRARRRSSWTSVRNGFSVIDKSPSRTWLQESSPLRAESGFAGIISPSAPQQFATDSGEPDGADEDPRPDRGHDGMQEDCGVEAVPERAKKDDARDADDDDRGDADAIAGQRERVRQNVEDDAAGDDEKSGGVVAPEGGERVFREAVDHFAKSAIHPQRHEVFGADDFGPPAVPPDEAGQRDGI